MSSASKALKTADKSEANLKSADKPVTPLKKFNFRLLIMMLSVGLVVQVLLASFFLSIGHAPTPQNVPIGLVGPLAVIEPIKQQLETDNRFSVRPYGSRNQAEDAILNRDVYGALIISQNPELLVSTASNLQIANLLRTGVAASMPNVKVTDIAPLPANDAQGGSASFMVQTLIIGALIAAIGIAQGVGGIANRTRRAVLALGAILVYSILSAEFMIVAAGWFGVAVSLDYSQLLFDLALVSFAVTGTIVAMMSLFGFAGLGISMLTFFLLGNIISGANLAPELLPTFWREIGTNIPTGAGISLVKNDLYFNGAATSYPLLILWLYAGISALIVLMTGGNLKTQPKH